MWKWMVLVAFLAGCQSQPTYYGKANDVPYAYISIAGNLGFYMMQAKDCTYLAMIAPSLAQQQVDLTSIEIATRVDENSVQKWAGTKASTTPETIAFNTDIRLLNQLTKGKTLRIKAEDAIFRVDLASAGEALKSLECDSGYFK